MVSASEVAFLALENSSPSALCFQTLGVLTLLQMRWPVYLGVFTSDEQLEFQRAEMVSWGDGRLSLRLQPSDKQLLHKQ